MLINQEHHGFTCYLSGKLTRENMRSVRLPVAFVLRSRLQGLQEWQCLLSGSSQRLNPFSLQILLTRPCHFQNKFSWNERAKSGVLAHWFAEIGTVFLHEFDPLRPLWRLYRECVHSYTWCVAGILAAFFVRRSSHTISSSCFHSLLSFSHLVEFIKPADVTEAYHVTIWPRNHGDNFEVKLARILNEKKVGSKRLHHQITLKPSFLLHKLTIPAKKKLLSYTL